MDRTVIIQTVIPAAWQRWIARATSFLSGSVRCERKTDMGRKEPMIPIKPIKVRPFSAFFLLKSESFFPPPVLYPRARTRRPLLARLAAFIVSKVPKKQVIEKERNLFLDLRFVLISQRLFGFEILMCADRENTLASSFGENVVFFGASHFFGLFSFVVTFIFAFAFLGGKVGLRTSSFSIGINNAHSLSRRIERVLAYECPTTFFTHFLFGNSTSHSTNKAGSFCGKNEK